MNYLLEPWPWYASGFLIAIVLFLFFYFGRNFGVSTNLETLCTISGANKFSDYFKKDWKERDWALVFLIGLVIGGFIASNYLSNQVPIDLNPKTITELNELGFANAGNTIVPDELFDLKNVFTPKGILILLIAGICIGFGTRYAGGCTSGHAITGLSSLQLPSLIAVIGFFIGGLVMVWLIFPLLFS